MFNKFCFKYGSLFNKELYYGFTITDFYSSLLFFTTLNEEIRKGIVKKRTQIKELMFADSAVLIMLNMPFSLRKKYYLQLSFLFEKLKKGI